MRLASLVTLRYSSQHLGTDPLSDSLAVIFFRSASSFGQGLVSWCKYALGYMPTMAPGLVTAALVYKVSLAHFYSNQHALTRFVFLPTFIRLYIKCYTQHLLTCTPTNAYSRALVYLYLPHLSCDSTARTRTRQASARMSRSTSRRSSKGQARVMNVTH